MAANGDELELTLADIATLLRKRVGGLMSNNVNLVRNLVTITAIAASVGRLNWP